VKGVQQDQRDFAEFYASTRDDCLRVVLLTTGDRPLAEDLVAEAYTRAWLAWRKVRGMDQPRAWVVRTALNTRISWWRRRRREVGLGGLEGVSPASHDAAAGSSSLDTDLVAALRRLPARQREVVALRLLLDLDTAATAEALGLAPGTVGSHLHRGLAALRRDLGLDPRTSRASTNHTNHTHHTDRAAHGAGPRTSRTSHLDPHAGRAGLPAGRRAADDQELTS
jgi:RNA polymerase sigma-70 factor (sigma-E family)